GSMHKKPAMSAEELGSTIVRSYKQSYTGGSQGNTAVVLSLLNLQKVPEIQESFNDFCSDLRKNISDIDKIEKCREEALKYSYGDYIDLAHFLYLLTKTSISSATRSSAAQLYRDIIGNKKDRGFVTSLAASGEKFANARGLSIFFPDRQGFKTYMNPYKPLNFCKETEWFTTLQEISVPNLPYLKIEDAVLSDKNKDGRIAAGEEVTLYLNIRNLGRKTLKSASVKCVTDSPYLGTKNFSVSLEKLPGPQKSELIPVMKFQVSETTPVHSEIVLNISLNGEGIPVSTFKTTFYVKEPFASTGHALLVMTDTFSPAGPAITEMLNNANVQFDTWDRVLDGDLRPEVLKRYLEGWILILVQDSTPQQSLTDKEIEALSEFLGAGGRLVLNGQDIAFSLRESPFLRDKCKASFIQDDVNVHVVAGTNGFANNQIIQIFGGDGANNQKWPDEIDALPGAQAIIRYEEKGRDMADESQMVGPNHKPGSKTKGIKSSGTAGIKVIDGYRLLLFTFGIEAINNKSQRTMFMKEIVKVMQPDVAAEMRNYASAANRRPSTRSSAETAIIERADLLSNVEDRLIGQIRREASKNPASARKLLDQIEKMPENEKKALKKLEKNIRSILEFDNQHGTLR
ncbi:MAG: clostripain-related cysteine peptidase, partial [Candidatus Rifleibacteriota bacterium]